MDCYAKLHTDLAQEMFNLGWFPEYLEAGDRGRLVSLAMLELCASNLRDDDLEYDHAVDVLSRAAESTVLDGDLSPVLFSLEHKPGSTSRVRTHKGFLRQMSFKQANDHEVTVSDGRTVFVGVVPVMRTNWEACFRALLDSSQSFLLLGCASEELSWLQETPQKWARIDSVARVDYMRLIPLVAQNGGGVASVGIGSLGDFVNFRLGGSLPLCAEARSRCAFAES
jgi:hypothetical protein